MLMGFETGAKPWNMRRPSRPGFETRQKRPVTGKRKMSPMRPHKDFFPFFVILKKKKSYEMRNDVMR